MSYIYYTILLALANQIVVVSWMSVQAGKCGIKATTELTAWREKQENDVPKTL